MKNIAIVVVLFLQLLFPFRQSAQAFLLQPDEPPVQAELFSVAHEPGGRLLVGLRMQMLPGWHVYWKYPGEVGLPVSISWSLPDGYRAGDLMFPHPERFEFEGMTGYGYSGEVVLFSTIEPEASDVLSSGIFPLTTEIEWLACGEFCMPGSARLELLSPEPDLQFASLARKWIDRLPKKHGEYDQLLQLSSAREKGGVTVVKLEYMGAGELRDFYPYAPPEGISCVDVSVDGKLIELSLEGDVAGVVLGGVAVSTEGVFDVATPALGVEQGGMPGILTLVLMLCFAFGGGVLLNVMPCVLPVLGLKVFSLVGPHGEESATGRYLSLFFAAGVLFSFWVMAGFVWVLQGMGEQIGWGFQFQSPAFIMFIAGLVFAFGLNLFGIFEFSAPVVSGKVGKLASNKDIAGSFVSGVLATTLATPCTAPFLGTALGFAFAQPPLLILVFFTVIALGMAAPYVLLAWHPAWLKFLPRPGQWMFIFKQVMGFVLFAVVIWLASILGSHGGTDGILALLLLLFCISIIVWGAAAVAGPGSSGRKRFGVWSLAIVLMLSAWQFFSAGAVQQAGRESAGGAYEDANGVTWHDFSPGLLAAYRENRQTVLIDFTADWCLTCKAMEAGVLGNPRVAETLARLGIEAVRADWTTRNDDITALLQRFGRSGVPLLVVIPKGDLEHAEVLPEVVSVGMLLEALERAVPAASELDHHM